MAYSPTTWVDNSAPALGAANLNHAETGIANALDKTDMTAKGDLLVATASGAYARLAVGANDTVAVADSAQATGVKWVQIGNAQIAVGAAIAPSKINIPYGTTLPVGPSDKDIAVLVDSITLPTYQWVFRWNAGSLNADKWEFMGGIEARSLVATSETTASTVDADLATVGPSFTLPRAGVYYVTPWITNTSNTAAAANFAAVYRQAVSQGFDLQTYMPTTGTGNMLVGGAVLVSGAAANDVVKLKYRVSSGTGTFANRQITIVPVRVS